MAVPKDDFKARRKMRQRRIRRRRMLISLAVLIVSAIITGIILSLTVLFPVCAVSASGSKIYSEQEIVNASKLSEDDNIITFSSGKVIKRLQKQLPYIESVTVKRKFPDTVKIEVTDAKEFACFPFDGEYYTVSRQKRVLNKYSEMPQGLFTVKTGNIICEPGEKLEFTDEKTENTLNILIEELVKKKIVINEIDITNQLALTVKVDNRFSVNLGTSGSLSQKIAHLGSMIKNIAPERSGRINLSMWTADKSEGTFTELPIEQIF